MHGGYFTAYSNAEWPCFGYQLRNKVYVLKK